MLVLDANILMRAVLGKQARALLAKYGERIEFVAPDVAFDEARKHLPEVIERRKLETAPFMDYFESLANVVQTVDHETYSGFEAIPRQRLVRRDENDWPILERSRVRFTMETSSSRDESERGFNPLFGYSCSRPAGLKSRAG